MNPIRIFKSGLINENPIFVQAIGMCPTLAVTTSAANGVVMGFSTLAVLACSNFMISLIRKFVPDKVRIPSYVVVIAAFVTLVQFLLEAYFAEINDSLGIFIPLIAVNCLILARAEAFAGKNPPLPSLLDGIAMGLGFAIALTVIGVIREFLGSGTVFGAAALPESFPRTLIMIFPPGAFITLGLMMALLNYCKGRRNTAENASASH